MTSTPHPGKPRILVADDDPSIRHAVRLKLERAGLDVVVAEDGETALRCALECEPDLFILDVSMPYMTGYDLCRELRRTERFKASPVIILTAMEQGIEATLAAELGVVRFMTKPFSPRELLENAQQLLASPDPNSPIGTPLGGAT
jgi:DNA-binding response OmpR family regulator